MVETFGLTDANQVSDLYTVLRKHLLLIFKTDAGNYLYPKEETILEVALTPTQKTHLLQVKI